MAYIDLVNQANNSKSLQNIQYLEGTIKIYKTGETISGQSAVMLKDGLAYKFNQSSEVNFGKIIGITRTAASFGYNVDVVYEGKINNPGWGLITNSIYYAGDNGSISTTVPSIGVIVRVGIAIDSDNLDVALGEEIIRI